MLEKIFALWDFVVWLSKIFVKISEFIEIIKEKFEDEPAEPEEKE